MSLLERARIDSLKIITNSNEFASEVTFIAPNEFTVTTNGIHAKHHTSFDEMQIRVNSKVASVSVAESNLVGYPVRNSKGEVQMKNHKVLVKDSTDIVKEYVVKENYPDEALGLIVFILGDYTNG
jgi:hypothetical protein